MPTTLATCIFGHYSTGAALMVRFGSIVGCCDEPPYSTFSDHPSLYNNYAFAIVPSTATVEAPGCHAIVSLAG